MRTDLNLPAIEAYASAYAEALAGKFFRRKEKISGEEVLSLSSVKQVNLFTLRELLAIWRQEIDKLRSPYFNYEAPEVVEALEAYQNALSNHISIDSPHFLPILKKGVYQCLTLVFDPFGFYERLTNQESGLSLAALQNELKYIRINQSPVLYLFSYMQENEIRSISRGEADLIISSHVKETPFAPQSEKEILADFSAMAPVDIEKFYNHPGAKFIELPSVKETSPVLQPTVMTAASAPKPPAPVPPAVKPPLSMPPAARQMAPPKINPQPNQPKIEAKQQTDATNQPAKTTLADTLARQRISNLKTQLSINQKFMFTKALFHGDFEIFENAIQKIDKCDNLAQAMTIINNEHSEWDRESEECEEFMDLLNKRFA